MGSPHHHTTPLHTTANPMTFWHILAEGREPCRRARALQKGSKRSAEGREPCRRVPGAVQRGSQSPAEGLEPPCARAPRALQKGSKSPAQGLQEPCTMGSQNRLARLAGLLGRPATSWGLLRYQCSLSVIGVSLPVRFGFLPLRLQTHVSQLKLLLNLEVLSQEAAESLDKARSACTGKLAPFQKARNFARGRATGKHRVWR